jgi:hypothetical protein
VGSWLPELASTLPQDDPLHRAVLGSSVPAATFDDPSEPVGLVISLYTEYFTLNDQNEKRAYTATVRPLLEGIEQGRLVPEVVEMLDAAKATYTQGCLVVEVHDYRGLRMTQLQAQAKKGDPAALAHAQEVLDAKKPLTVERVVLRPDDSTAVADSITFSLPSWNPAQIFTLERALLHTTASPVCFDPDSRVLSGLVTIRRMGTGVRQWRSATERLSKLAQTRRRALSNFLLHGNAVDPRLTLVNGMQAAARRRQARDRPPVSAIPPEKLQDMVKENNTAMAARRGAGTNATTAQIPYAFWLPHLASAGPRPSPVVKQLLQGRVLRLEGKTTFVLFTLEDSASGGYTGALSIRSLDDERRQRLVRAYQAGLVARQKGKEAGQDDATIAQAVAAAKSATLRDDIGIAPGQDELLRFPLGSAQAAKAFVAQLKALCKRKDVYTVMFDSIYAAVARAAARVQQQQQQQKRRYGTQ